MVLLLQEELDEVEIDQREISKYYFMYSFNDMMIMTLMLKFNKLCIDEISNSFERFSFDKCHYDQSQGNKNQKIECKDLLNSIITK